MIGIYGIFRKSDDKCMYVGQSSDIDGRIKHHLNGHTKNSFNKDEYYGEMIEQHFINDKQYRLEREAYWIEQLQPELNVVRDETNRGEYFSGVNAPMYGKHPDHRGEKNPMYGKHPDHRGEKNPKYGKHFKWINNGTITKHVNQDDLDKYIQDGWKLGRLK